MFIFQTHRSGIGQRQGGTPALPTSVKLQQLKSISKLYRQLLGNGAPISQWHSPFLAYVAISEVDKLFKGGGGCNLNCVSKVNNLFFFFADTV